MGFVVIIGIIILAFYLMLYIMSLIAQKIPYPLLAVFLTLIIGGIILIFVGFIAFIFGLAGYFDSALPPSQ